MYLIFFREMIFIIVLGVEDVEDVGNAVISNQ